MPVQLHQRERVHIHRRKASKDDDGGDDANSDTPTAPLVSLTQPGDDNNTAVINVNGGVPPRTRIHSTPAQLSPSWSTQTFSSPPPLPPPIRSTFPTVPPQNGSPIRPSFSMPQHHPPKHSHSRTLSIPTPFSPNFPSPLSASFPTPPPQSPTSPITSANPSHRHTRLHSRNLSVFFPRPNALPHTAIAEDGTQELEFSDHSSVPTSAVPSADLNSTKGQLVPGFSFGKQPPTSAGASPSPGASLPSTGGMSRRGHHHKHSMSHNFFSFLEPGAGSTPTTDLHTQPTPIPVSPWTSVSNLPKSQSTEKHIHTPSLSPTTFTTPPPPPPPMSRRALTWSVVQFVLGARMWIAGQQIGALSCTGLGYWVVFDAMGVAVSRVVPGWLAKSSDAKSRVRRSYGNARVETVLMFAQAVYLMFASVYVCKEAVEHLLLSFGEGGHGHGHGHGGGVAGSAVHSGAEGHHHHQAEDGGIGGVEFPLALTFLTLLSLLGSAFVYDNHAKLVQIANNHIPPITTLLRDILSPARVPRTFRHYHRGGVLHRVLSNPFIASPVFFCLAILGITSLVDPLYHRASDLALAGLEMVITFIVAYRACVVLGAVLLQTSPPRGLSGGRMEAFLRAMKEVERHPKVLHLPAPHLWQLTPSYASLPYPSSPTVNTSTPILTQPRSQALVATLELHVHADLDDEQVLKLTRWAWERCVLALGGHVGAGAGGEGESEGTEREDRVEVTVGVVRG